MAELIGTGSVAGAEVSWAAMTDVGNHRALNEDSILVAPPVFAVADGMGGHDAGEVASSLTAERLRTLASDLPVPIDAISGELHHINALLRGAAMGGSDAVMGTTTVGLAAVDNGGLPSWLVFNIGDSRAYAWSDGAMHQVSKDHSFVQELVDAAEIDQTEARTHPHRNVVTRALGADAEAKPDYWIRPMRPGERYLLCSDGLSGEVDDATLASVLGAQLPPDETAAALIGLALGAGGRDNISVIVVDVVSVPAWDDSSTERNSAKLRELRAATGLPVAEHVAPTVQIAPDPEIVVIEPVTHEPVTHEPVTHEPVTHELVAQEPVDTAGEALITDVPRAAASAVVEAEAGDDPGPAPAAAISSVPVGPAVTDGEEGAAEPAEALAEITPMPEGGAAAQVPTFTIPSDPPPSQPEEPVDDDPPASGWRRWRKRGR